MIKLRNIMKINICTKVALIALVIFLGIRWAEWDYAERKWQEHLNSLPRQGAKWNGIFFEIHPHEIEEMYLKELATYKKIPLWQAKLWDKWIDVIIFLRGENSAVSVDEAEKK
jgi:hypothetical protein